MDEQQIMEASWKRVKRLLNYTELLVLPDILAELHGATTGVFVASKVADSHSVARSVIVVLLRLLEAAGLIESRSMGTKGTHIKVKFSGLLDEARKLAA